MRAFVIYSPATMPPTPQAQASAKELRQNMTDAEKLLWSKLRNRQLYNFKFRRQQPIGIFIADFYCAKAKLVIELDGHAHADKVEYDLERTRWLNSVGYMVLRFWNGAMSWATRMEYLKKSHGSLRNDQHIYMS